MDHSSNTPTVDRVLELLSHHYRRRILTRLVDEAELTVEECTPEGKAGIRIACELFHNHLPKLDSADSVTWDARTETIRRGQAFEDVEPVIRLLSDNSDVVPGGWP